ncbi:MAG: SPOR domain-containing protein, partial [Sinobacteraceae bacterium]|nr:SPOR domain-containing protein [Nevskiaceae bacterium]
MRRSSARQPPVLEGLNPSRARAIPTLLLCGALLGGANAALAQIGGMQPPGRFIDVVDVSDRGDQVDLTIQFNCSMRYLTNVPVSQGAEVRVQLQPLPDCGINPLTQISGETAPISGGSGIVTAVRVESDAPGQVTVVLNFKKSEQFVLAQGVDPRGLRMRLLNRAPTRGRIMVNQSTDTVSNFAINLDSQPQPFDPAALQLAHERLQAPVFVSETLVNDQKWYRLRVGPIDRQADAERLLNRALEDYPRAWIAMGDDAITSDPNAPVADGALPGVQPIGSDPPLDAALLKSLLSQARTAMAANDYPKAIALLTKLQRQPEFPGRAQAQELLGLSRERSGQLAHAKAEYVEYLRRYPQGEAAEKVATRLRILRLASAKSHGGPIETGQPESPWQLNGGFAQLYRYDGTRVNSTTSSGTTTTGTTTPPGTVLPGTFNSTQTTSNALYNDVDLFARRRGENIDFLSRLSAGFAKDFGNGGGGIGGGSGDFTRVSLASVELIDHSLGLLARLGRQISTQDGILGTFDGLFVSYQFKPAWSVNVAAGYPVLQTNEGP